MKKLTIPAAIVAVLLIGLGVWYFILSDDGPEKADAECDPAPCAASSVDDVNGTWDVQPDSKATFSITETIGSIADHKAVGEVQGLTGSVEVAAGKVTEATFNLDLTKLEFTDTPAGFNAANRTGAMNANGLEIGQFPTATFTLIEDVALGADVLNGKASMVDATGELTIHGMTKEVTLKLKIVADGANIRVTPTDFVPVLLADYGVSVEAPGFVASISDNAKFDFLVVLAKS